MIHRIIWFVLFVLAIGFPQTKISKIDSLAIQLEVVSKQLNTVTMKAVALEANLEKEKLSAAYSKEAMAHVITSDGKIMDNLYAFMAWMGSIFAASLVGFGFFIWKRTQDERKFIGREVKDALEPDIKRRIDEVDGKATSLRTDLNSHVMRYNEFTGEINRKADRIEALEMRVAGISEIEGKLSVFGEIQDQAIWSYARSFSEAAWENWEAGQYDEAMDNQAFIVQSCEKGGRKDIGSGKIMIKSAAEAMALWVPKVKFILPRTRDRIQKILPLVPEQFRLTISAWLEKVQVVDELPNQGKPNVAAATA